MTDYPDYQTPQAHANSIAQTGVPLLTGANVLLQQTFNPAALATQSSGTITVSQIGYEVVVQASFGVAPGTPFAEVQLEWKSSGFVARVATDTFICVASTTPGAFTTYLTGPTKGDQLVVHVTNLDNAQTATVSVQALENSRVYDRDQIRWDNALNTGKTVTGWTLPTLPTDESVLGMVSGFSIAASGNKQWLVAPHNGLVDFGFDFGTGVPAGLAVAVQAVPATYYVSNNPLYGSNAPVPSFQIASPRAPVRLQLANNATTATVVTWSAMRAD